MRLLLVNELAGCVGGAEVHLRQLIPGLRERGHEVAFLHGQPAPDGPARIAPEDVPAWCTSTAGAAAVLAGVDAWGPDLVYAHRLINPAVLGPLLRRRPSVFFLHGYFGVCISGARCLKAPRPRPCARKFGWGCLGWYFPRRCGGWNPWTMWRDFRRERRQQVFLRRFDLLLTHSEHVRDEYIRHGQGSARTRCVPFFVAGEPLGGAARTGTGTGTGPLRLLFVGRFDVLKGGALLLEALPAIARITGRPVTLVMAGDGPERGRWERMAGSASAGTGVRVEFPGWLTGPGKAAAMASAHLLVVPSVWPEPFGMTGLESGFHGVPAVAFDVGGVRAWLRPGVNGRLAPGAPPSAVGLAEAVAGAVADPAGYESLGAGARRVAGEFTRERHLAALEREFAEVRENRGVIT